MTSDWIVQQVAGLAHAWARLAAIVDELDDAGFAVTLPEGRSVKQVLAHIAFWEEAAVGFVRGAIRGEKLETSDWYGGGALGIEEGDPWPDADTHNAREALWAAGVEASAVTSRLRTARAGFLDLLNSLEDREVEGDAGRYLRAEDHLSHFQTHLADIEVAVRRGSG